MTDTKKSKLLMLLMTTLTVLTISYNVLQKYVMPDIEGYWQRKLYYERVISKKGLTLQKGMYWKEKK
ncbi:MAG: hypothetical protein AAB275_04015 [Deltaproteobacteria bacterium]